MNDIDTCILISRKITGSEIWEKPPLYLKVWIYLLVKAQHTTYKKLKRGQLFTSIREIQDSCGHKVGYRKERPTKDQIYQILAWLRSADEGGDEADTRATMIATTKATHGLLVTIVKYDHYQNFLNYGGNSAGNNEKPTKPTREQRSPDNINNNDKNDNNNIPPIVPLFDTFWKEYPKKQNKQTALKAWTKLNPSDELTREIIDGVRRFKTCEQWTSNNGQFVPHASTFINGRRWEDEIKEIKPEGTRWRMLD